jgi:hypothetical protein
VEESAAQETRVVLCAVRGSGEESWIVGGSSGAWSKVGVGIIVVKSRSLMMTVLLGECQIPSEVV